jgi:hypothetical protein
MEGKHTLHIHRYRISSPNKIKEIWEDRYSWTDIKFLAAMILSFPRQPLQPSRIFPLSLFQETTGPEETHRDTLVRICYDIALQFRAPTISRASSFRPSSL